MPPKRFKSEDWLTLALSQLSAHGPDALRLEAICKTAGLTKGSFYHHFKDHDAFLQAVVHEWENRHTQHLIDQVDIPADPTAAMGDLSDMAMALDYHLEIGIRDLGRRIPEIAAVVQSVDTRRIDFLAQIYRAVFDVTDQDATVAAKIEYAAFMGLILIQPDIDKTEQRTIANRFADVMRTYFNRDRT